MKFIARIFSLHATGMFFTDLFLCSFRYTTSLPEPSQEQKEEYTCFPYPLEKSHLLFPLFKPKAQLGTTQLRCCYLRNNLGKVSLDFSSAGSAFYESWRHCLCPDSSWEQEQPSSVRGAVWLAWYRNNRGCVMLGWSIKCSSAPFPPVNQLCSSVGSLALMSFRLRTWALFFSTSMSRRIQFPFFPGECHGYSLGMGLTKGLDTGRRTGGG